MVSVRGVTLTYETVRKSCLKFGQNYANDWRRGSTIALVHNLEPVSRFEGGRKVATYVGLEPMEYSSGDKRRLGSISKGGSRLLRYLLVEAAQTAVRRDEELKKFYLRLEHRRGTLDGRKWRPHGSF